MNKVIEQIPENQILFFDVESVRKEKELDMNSKEFEMYKWKIRDRENDELLSDLETQEHYRKYAALKFPYSKIVAISVGYIKDDSIVIKSLEGTEEEMLKDFYSISTSFKYVCGANILSWDLPLCRIRLSTYANVLNYIPDAFNDSGKKPWNLGSVIDIFDLYKGTHYANASLEELCYLYGVDSSKDNLRGADVSEAYYNGKIGEIKKYCNDDVVATINVFRRMIGFDIIKNVLVREESVKKEPLEMLYNTNDLSIVEDAIVDKIKSNSKGKISEKEKEVIKDILMSVYTRTDFANNDEDSAVEKKLKEVEVENLIKKL